MASLTRHKAGWLVQFTRDGKRISLYPGLMQKRQAEKFRQMVEALLSARTQGTYPGDDASAWVARQDASTRLKLHAHGLIEQPAETVQAEALGRFLDGYMERHATAKRATLTVWGRCRRLLLTYFKADRPLTSITLADAQDWRSWMLVNGKKVGTGNPAAGLGENTVRKMCSVASQILTDAVDRGLLTANPFAHKSIPRTTKENRGRDHFIPRDVAEIILESITDPEWQLIFALSRYGGLRCPSETLSLRWQDVLWDQSRIIVTSPKTAHHEGKGQRVIPIFPELRPYLDEAFHAASDGAVYCISRYRRSESNLGTQLKRLIERAGIQPWPKLLHNLRASRETELVESFPIQTVCSWIGNSPAVAMRHYLTVPVEHFTRASMGNAKSNAEPDGMQMNSSEQVLSKP